MKGEVKGIYKWLKINVRNGLHGPGTVQGKRTGTREDGRGEE